MSLRCSDGPEGARLFMRDEAGLLRVVGLLGFMILNLGSRESAREAVGRVHSWEMLHRILQAYQISRVSSCVC